MSSKDSPEGKGSGDKIIPIRRVPLSQLPSDYSATPGGTLFSTTPGGTRIIYDRDFLMQCRNSPLTKSPPANLPNIPGITHPTNNIITHRENNGPGNPAPAPSDRIIPTSPTKKKENADDAQFQMDI